MTFGADYINDEHFTDVIEGKWVYCFDIRDTKHFGDYACINNLGFDTGNEYEYKARIIEHLIKLPKDTIFFFQDSHW